MRKLLACVVLVVFAPPVWAQSKEPLRLVSSTPLPGVEGDFDHFGVDVKNNRLYLTGEDHKSVEVFELRSGKHLRSLKGFETPHSILCLPNAHKLMVIDGGPGEVKVLNDQTYEVKDTIKLTVDADSMGYDADKKLLYVDNGGREAKQDYSLLSVIDTNTDKKVADIKVDSNRIEAMAIEKSGPRLFLNDTGKARITVINREKREILGQWPIPDAEQNVPMALDEANHRLFVATRKPSKFIAFDTESGKPVASLPANGRADDMSFDANRNRIYIAAGEGFVDVYQEKDPDHYEAIGKIPTGPVAKIGTFVPELNHYYVAVSAKDKEPAKVLIFETQ